MDREGPSQSPCSYTTALNLTCLWSNKSPAPARIPLSPLKFDVLAWVERTKHIAPRRFAGLQCVSEGMIEGVDEYSSKWFKCDQCRRGPRDELELIPRIDYMKGNREHIFMLHLGLASGIHQPCWSVSVRVGILAVLTKGAWTDFPTSVQWLRLESLGRNCC